MGTTTSLPGQGAAQQVPNPQVIIGWSRGTTASTFPCSTDSSEPGYDSRLHNLFGQVSTRTADFERRYGGLSRSNLWKALARPNADLEAESHLQPPLCDR